MKQLLERLFQYQHLTRTEAKEVLGHISEGKFNPTQVSAFLTVFRMRSIHVEELIGFRDCMRERCNHIDLNEFDPVDLCGTGGDGKDTFNISTLASFVVAGAGYKVAKHGNYGVSSACGSSNLMEHLGYRFTDNADVLRRQIDQSGICFLHAPLFHPAMKNVAPIRKEMGVHTFFNMLGPMVNPSFPKRQMVGVFSLELLRYYKHIMEMEDASYRIVHSLDGYDELSLTSDAMVVSPTGDRILRASELTVEPVTTESLHGGKAIAESATIFMSILSGNGTREQNTVVTANAAMAMQCYHPEKTISELMEMAKESLLSGRALNALKNLISI